MIPRQRVRLLTHHSDGFPNKNKEQELKQRKFY